MTCLVVLVIERAVRKHDPNWSIIGNRSALSRGNRWVLPCVPLESGSSERGQAELPLSILFSCDEDRVCRTERGRLRQAHRPTKVIIGSPCACSRSTCEPLDERKARRLRSPGYRPRNASAFFSILFGGQGFATGACRWSPCGHGLSLSQQSMPCGFSLQRRLRGDGLCSQPTKIAARKTSSNQGAFATR